MCVAGQDGVDGNPNIQYMDKDRWKRIERVTEDLSVRDHSRVLHLQPTTAETQWRQERRGDRSGQDRKERTAGKDREETVMWPTEGQSLSINMKNYLSLWPWCPHESTCTHIHTHGDKLTCDGTLIESSVGLTRI